MNKLIITQVNDVFLSFFFFFLLNLILNQFDWFRCVQYVV